MEKNYRFESVEKLGVIVYKKKLHCVSRVCIERINDLNFPQNL